MSDFKKTLKQKDATSLMSSDAKHIMLYGGSRSGKTFQIVSSIIIRACKTPSRHLTLRQQFNSVKTSVWLDTLPKVMKLRFPFLKLVENKTDLYLKFPNGSEYWFSGLDDDKRIEKILGKEYSTIHFNEVSQMSYSSVQIALTRLAEKNNLKKKCYYDQNPPSKRHWTYWLFEQGLSPIENEPLKNAHEYSSMLMNPIDNMDNIDEDYLNLLAAMPEKEKNRFLMGLYTDDSDGIAYYSFSKEKHVKETKRIAGQLMIGMDFNVDPMTAVIGQIIDNVFHVHDEIYLNNSDTYKMTHALKEKQYFGSVYPDSTGANRKTSGMSDFEILRLAGLSIQKTHNPFVTDRVNNLNRLFQEDRIVINPRCKKLINDLQKVSWKDNKLDQKTDKMLTHISDCLGYWTWAIEPMAPARKPTSGRWA